MLSSSLRCFIVGLAAFGAIGNVVNAQAPLPSCDSLGVASQFDCRTQCTNKGSDIQGFLDANGVAECICTTAKLCDDNPSCAEVLVEPGKAEVQCRSLCPSGTVITADDYAEFPSATNANPDQTHLKVSCSCSGQKQCSDSILFSDKVNLPECYEKGITSQETCKAHCESFGTVFLGYDYNTRCGDDTICTCTGPNGEPKAPYCEDLARRACGGSAITAATTAVMMLGLVIMFLML